MKVRHTFLFEEGLWSIAGDYHDQQGGTVPMQGSAKITHAGDIWKSEGVMKIVQPDREIEIRNDYEIAPFEKGMDYTGWTSANPVLGRLTGLFVVVDDSIISTLASEDGEISGVETLIKVSDYTYKSRGFIFKGEERISSWAVELTKGAGGLH